MKVKQIEKSPKSRGFNDPLKNSQANKLWDSNLLGLFFETNKYGGGKVNLWSNFPKEKSYEFNYN